MNPIRFITHKWKRLEYLIGTFKLQSYELGKIYEEIVSIRNDLGVKQTLRRPLDYSWLENILCAHAMGNVDGVVYTNSKEAFIQNYQNGCRLFELDISLTKEGFPVLCHDWRQVAGNEFVPYQKALRTADKQTPMKYADFMIVRFNGKYTPLDLDGFTDLAKEYDDAYFIVSIKSPLYVYDESVRACLAVLEMLCRKKGAGIWERMIPQVHDPVYYFRLIADFPVRSVLYGMRNVQLAPETFTTFLHESGIKAVACDHGKPFTNPETFDAIHSAGAKVYIATVNDSDEMRKWKEMGADGFLTDFGFPQGVWQQ